MTPRSLDSNTRRALAGQREFDREKFLLPALVGVFRAQIVIYSASLTPCLQVGSRAQESTIGTKHLHNLNPTFDLALSASLAPLSGISFTYACRMRQGNEAKLAVPLDPDQPNGPPPPT
jgi:hypothetical protein